MAGQFETAGARAPKEVKFAPLFIENFGAGGGLFTNRSPLSDPSSLYERRYLGGRPGALFGGLNTEISQQNTLIRRYGVSAFSTAIQVPHFQHRARRRDDVSTVPTDRNASDFSSVASHSFAGQPDQ